MNLIDQIRSEVLRHSLSLPTVSRAWALRRAILLGRLGHHAVTPRDLVDLGDGLSDAFRCIGQDNRDQSSLSAGGAVWSALVSWYLNLCYAGTHAVAFCGGKFIPRCIRDSVSVIHQNKSVGSDVDVVVLSAPGIEKIETQSSLAAAKSSFADYCEKNFEKLGLVILQCKTNWNDNAQVPMLWNLLFTLARRGGVPSDVLGFGRNNWSLANLGYFAYAFVTVPTSSGGPTGFLPTSLPVLRASVMSGGSYWGYPTTNGVCRSLKEFFNHQFSACSSIMPNVSSLGVAYSSELVSPADLCHLEAFALHRGHAGASAASAS